MPIPRLTLYGRSGCHLCEVAAEHLRRLNFNFQEVDIAGNDVLEEQYGFDIPVLTRGEGAGEEVLAKGVLTPQRLGVLKLVLLREEQARGE